MYPRYGIAYFNRGCETWIRRFKSAIADYTKAIEYDPNYASAYNNRGTSKDELNDYQGAITDYTKAIELKPDYYKAYTNRGITLESRSTKGACMTGKAVDLGDTKPIEWVRNQCWYLTPSIQRLQGIPPSTVAVLWPGRARNTSGGHIWPATF